ncbi:MAG TPA: Nif3-like dinuclear metal center hexameric protein [Tissierellia bacterium]|nr:Nif3-like dinuclear metal center hexameric protein [Tissierellia bacterium]
MDLKSIIDILESELKLKPQDSWDNSGLQIGSTDSNINKIMLTLDLDMEATEEAVKENVDLIITHHPFFFGSIKKIDLNTYDGKIIRELINSSINLYSIHTNYDIAEYGVSANIAQKLNIKDYKVLQPINSDESGYGGIGEISPVNILDYAKKVKESLNANGIKLYCSDYSRIIKRVAFCGGSGSDFIDNAIKEEADVYITGDIKYHQAQWAIKNNLCVIDAGHYNTEIHSLGKLKEILEKANMEVILFKKNMTAEMII